ncbi:unnamed protein product (mitochondrion) [Plasmodiophora brassicae]|uniref:Kinesin motor domain-containing protein n=1 Tax=Plasmodiophora brassicae TaxID=37360 RepID=A0A0G4IUJ8_PLABS|nr:hypothetical protein PBRA_007026 [Plasmodiophora brassicae]SPQ92985.1 unnamed protein product [Plasmodiophora brassicae]
MDAAKIKVGLRLQPGTVLDSAQVDHKFPSGSSNRSVYEDLCRPLIGKALLGHNVAIVCYGANAAREPTLFTGGTDPGVMLRAVNDVFDHVQVSTDRAFLIRLSVFAVAADGNTVDLLCPDSSRPCRLIDDRHAGAAVDGLVEIVVPDARQVSVCLQQALRVQSALQRRRFAMVNVFADLHIESCATIDAPCRVSLLRFARIDDSDNGIISVADAIASGASPEYRSTNVTRLLEFAIGGNGFAAFVVTSGTSLATGEKLARVFNRPVENTTAPGDVIRQLRVEVGEIRARMELDRPGDKVDDIDAGLMEALATKMAQLRRAKSDTWAERRRRSVTAMDERKRVLERESLLFVLDEPVECDPDIAKRTYRERDAFVRASLAFAKARIEVDGRDPNAPGHKDLVDDLARQREKLDKIRANFNSLVELAVEDEQKQRALYVSGPDLDKLHALADDIELLDLEALKAEDPKFIKIKGKLDNDYRNRCSEISDRCKGGPAEAAERDILDREHRLIEQLENVKWERDEVIGRLIERESRHRAQNAQMQREMLNVFRDYRVCLDQRLHRLDAMYRGLLDDAVRDVLRLQSEKTTLERRLRSMGQS